MVETQKCNRERNIKTFFLKESQREKEENWVIAKLK